MNTTTTSTFPTFTVTVKGAAVTFTSAFETLDAAARYLEGRPDRSEFVDSLLHACNGLRGASVSQAAWIHKLATDAFQPAQRGRFVADIDLLPIVELLHTAQAAAKKAPVIKLQAASGAPVVLRLAGERSKRPGTVSVTDGRPYGSSRYFGTIDLTGGFHEGGSCCDEVRDVLHALAENPSHVAGQHGVATGSCCFCSRPLSTKESRSVGYGPDCADRYGLPWGEVSAEVIAADEAAKQPLVAPALPAGQFDSASEDILRVLGVVRRFAESKGAIGNEVLGAPVATSTVRDELQLPPTVFGATVRDCVRLHYLTRNGGDVITHRVALTAQGLQVLQIGD